MGKIPQTKTASNPNIPIIIDAKGHLSITILSKPNLFFIDVFLSYDKGLKHL